MVFVDENLEASDKLRGFVIDVVAQSLVTNRIQWQKENWKNIGGEISAEVLTAVQKLVA